MSDSWFDQIVKWYEQANDNVQEFIHDPFGFYQESHDPVRNAWEGEMQDESDYWFQQFLVSSPLAPVFKGKWNKDALVNYMNRYGLTWNDLISRNVMNSQFATHINPINFVGDMVKDLYS